MKKNRVIPRSGDRVKVTAQLVHFSYAYECDGCGTSVHLTGETMDSFHEASQLFGKQLCIECDGKTVPAKRLGK